MVVIHWIFFFIFHFKKNYPVLLSPGGAFPNGFASQSVISLSVCQSHVSLRGLVSFVTLFIIKVKCGFHVQFVLKFYNGVQIFHFLAIHKFIDSFILMLENALYLFKVKDFGYKCLQGSFNSIILDIHWVLIDFMIALQGVPKKTIRF